MSKVTMNHAHLFCSSGGGGIGFNMANPRAGGFEGEWKCIGGVDVDPGRCRDFEQFTGAPATVMDLFSRPQYIAHNGQEPPAGWREVLPDDIRRAFGHQHPTAIVTSPPCRGFSGLLSAMLSVTAKYQALNELTLRGVWLLLEAYADDPVEFYVLENVPLLQHRGSHLLEQIVQLLRRFGYAVAKTVHDCGEIGELAQSRKRFLLMARHLEKIPPFLYQPDRKPLRAVGDVLGRMLPPGDLRAGPMHRVPRLQWKTWARLAMVTAGSDWRSLNRLAVVDGELRDYLIVPGGSRVVPTVGLSLADPRFQHSDRWNAGQQYGVHRWSEASGTVTGQQSPGQGRFAVADPREQGQRLENAYRVVRWQQPAGTENCAIKPTVGALADPRPAGAAFGKYEVTAWGQSARTVIGGSTTGQGAFAVADPRPGMRKEQGASYLTAGHYGVVAWNSSSGAVPASACHDNGSWSVADPRRSSTVTDADPCRAASPLPAPADKMVARILSEDGTWHRPFTTLELAALQSLYDPDEWRELEEMNAWREGRLVGADGGMPRYFRMEGSSDTAYRERIGDMIPPAAAKQVATVIGEAFLLAKSGETFILSAQPVWVRPLARALTLPNGSEL